MTELIIDGIQAVLPQSFSIQVKRENPLITKNGEYTYDVTLDLSNPTNAALFGHLNRLNSIADAKTRRPAVLIADNRVYCDGTEVVTGWTDDTVSIQIASGNSELNSIIGGDRLISTLTTMPESDLSNAVSYDLTKVYPDVDFCLAPVYNTTAATTINNWSIGPDSIKEYNLKANPIYAQPFLCAYIREVLKAVGYTLAFNFIEETEYKSLYIAQASHATKWCEMLPGWTVADFLTQLEYLFNAAVVVDGKSKAVTIQSQTAAYAGRQSVHVRDVNDVYEVDVEDELNLDDITQSNVTYKVEDSEFWRWRRLPDVVLNNAKRAFLPKGIPVYDFFKAEVNHRQDVIYLGEIDGLWYVYKEPTEAFGYRDNHRVVNRFPDIKRDGASNTIELEIIPATLDGAPIPYAEWNADKQRWDMYHVDVPMPNVAASTPVDLATLSIPDMVRDNTSESSVSKSPVNIAFYYGLGRWNSNNAQKFPTSYIDRYDPERGLDFDSGYSLRLPDMQAKFYQQTYTVDALHAIKIKSFDPNVYHANSVFEIRNKRYLCAYIEYTLGADGRKGAWEGLFYPVTISDTEADARWILTDGRWRDGGVWLDNGRWLDD